MATPTQELRNKRKALWEEHQSVHRRLVHQESIEELVQRCGLPQLAVEYLKTLERVEYYGDTEDECEFTRYAMRFRLLTKGGEDDSSNKPLDVDCTNEEPHLPRNILGWTFDRYDIELMGDDDDGVNLSDMVAVMVPNIRGTDDEEEEDDEKIEEAVAILRKKTLTDKAWTTLLSLGLSEKGVLLIRVLQELGRRMTGSVKEPVNIHCHCAGHYSYGQWYFNCM